MRPSPKYGASKAGLDRIVLAAAKELGHQNTLANLINPGPIKTVGLSGRRRKF
jgi:3-oxoacyl-[acyl-carrier protein] reductase